MGFLHKLIIMAGLLMPAAASADLAMVMVEQRGCIWCARWDAEIAPIWPQTPHGQIAPLRRIDLHSPIPADLDLSSRPRITPTFILTDDGDELGRIEGYPGETLFWMMISRLFEGIDLEQPEMPLR